MLNDFTKFNGDTMNDYIDKALSRSRENSSSNLDGAGKIVRSVDGTPIKMHLDLSSILKKREDE